MNKYLEIFLIILFSFASTVIVCAQTGSLSGYVYDNTGQPVVGANILLKGTNYGAASDSKGLFIIPKIPFGNYTLQISFIGLKKDTIKVVFDESYKPVNITLQPVSIETEQVIVSAGKYEQKLSDVTVSTAILGPEIISSKNILHFDEILRYIPGVNVEINQVSIRGSSGYSKGAGTRVLVAIDGIPVYTGDTGEIVWELIPLADIERIEVIKGPASSLYGQTAIGGVINIITRKTPDKSLTYFKTFAGIYGDPSYSKWKWNSSPRTFYGLEASHTNMIGKLGYTISLKKFKNDGYRQNDYNTNYSGYVKLDYDIDTDNSFKFLGYFLNMDRGNFLYWKDSRNALVPQDDEIGLYIKTNRQFASMIYRHNFSQSFTADLKTSFYRSSLEGVSDRITSIASDLIRNELISTIKINNKWVMITGAEFAYAFVNSTIFANPHFLTGSVYAQSEYRLSEKINSVLGLRYDYIKLADVTDASALTPRAGLNYKFSNNLILRASFATGFRAPTPAEAFIAADATGGITVVNNPKLDYETSLSYELGFVYKHFTSLKIDAAFFNTDYKNFIEPILTADGTIKFINLLRARIQGFEIVTNFNPGSSLPQFSLGYDYLWATDLDKKQFLKYRPRHTVYGSIEFNISAFELRTDLRYWSKIEEIDFDLTVPPINLIPDGQNRSDAFVVDLSIGYNFKINSNPLKVFVNGKNIFNYNYVEFIGNIAPIRNFSLSLEAYF